VVAEESVQLSRRDVDKTPVMELLRRLSDSEPPQSLPDLEPLQLLHGVCVCVCGTAVP